MSLRFKKITGTEKKYYKYFSWEFNEYLTENLYPRTHLNIELNDNSCGHGYKAKLHTVLTIIIYSHCFFVGGSQRESFSFKV